MSTEQYDIGLAAAAVHVCGVARVCSSSFVCSTLSLRWSGRHRAHTETPHACKPREIAGKGKGRNKIWARGPCAPLERVSSQRQHDEKVRKFWGKRHVLGPRTHPNFQGKLSRCVDGRWTRPSRPRTNRGRSLVSYSSLGNKRGKEQP